MKPIQLREADFKREIEPFKYPESMKKEFFDYWSEPNKSGTKMRFELETTWHLSRRLARWANNGFGNKGKEITGIKKQLITDPKNDLERIQVLFDKYILHPTSVPFSEFGKFYSFMKESKLLKRFTLGEINELIEIYNGDNEKCRCACVQLTFDEYTKRGVIFIEL